MRSAIAPLIVLGFLGYLGYRQFRPQIEELLGRGAEARMEAAALDAMRASLAAVAIHQEAVYAMGGGGRLAGSAPSAAVTGVSPDVEVRIVAATAEGWVAEATHRALPGRSCVQYGGRLAKPPVTRERRLSPDRPGVPACD